MEKSSSSSSISIGKIKSQKFLVKIYPTITFMILDSNGISRTIYNAIMCYLKTWKSMWRILGKTQSKAYKQALQCDPVSAFGGIVAFNKSLSKETARDISKLFTEVIVAPDFDRGC